jgi:hypothetical protein
MTIEAECCALKTGSWGKPKSGEAKLGSSKNEHAERIAYKVASRDGGTTYKIRMNAFPCKNCIEFFLKESKSGKSFVFACEANDGSYAREAGYIATGEVLSADDEKRLHGFLYMKSGLMYAKQKPIAIKYSNDDNVTITTTRCDTVADNRPPELISFPESNTPTKR